MSIYEQTSAAINELCEKAKLKPGNIVIVGCSTSEVVGQRSERTQTMRWRAKSAAHFSTVPRMRGIYLAVQCCEHLNRAVITERAAVPFAEPVNAVPQPKAGGSLATQAYAAFTDPIALEEIKADAGLDIGFTLIGMHLKKVAVPLRLENNTIGETMIIAARTRPKFIGGVRAKYDEELL